jgi:uncharacterized membrane protein YjfL (UPF0719 family)
MDYLSLYHLGFVLGTTLVLLLLSLGLERLFTGPGGLKAAEGNTARALVEAGQIVATFLLSAAVVAGSVRGESLAADALYAGLFGGSGALLLSLTGRLSTMLLLRSRLPKEIGRGNAAAGLAAAGHYLATGVLLASCLYGADLATFGVSLLFFALAKLTLHLLVLLFRALTPYDDAEEVLNENAAAALSYAGVTVALAILIGNAAEGAYVGLAESLAGYGVTLLLCLALYPVRQLLVQGVILRSPITLRRGRLERGIAEERNLGVALLEASTYLATALLVTVVT